MDVKLILNQIFSSLQNKITFKKNLNEFFFFNSDFSSINSKRISNLIKIMKQMESSLASKPSVNQPHTTV